MCSWVCIGYHKKHCNCLCLHSPVIMTEGDKYFQTSSMDISSSDKTNEYGITQKHGQNEHGFCTYSFHSPNFLLSFIYRCVKSRNNANGTYKHCNESNLQCK